MKFLCLTSGGKDSFYAMQKAIEFGHELVAIGTVIHTFPSPFPAALAQILCKPLLSSLWSSSSPLPKYQELLQTVKYRFPEIDAVVSGVVSSHSQRIDIEAMCELYGFVSICPLWLMDEERVVREETEAGVEIVITEATNRGLLAEFVGKSLKEMSGFETEMREKLGIRFSSEGGDITTAVVDSPLLTRKIILSDCETVEVNEGRTRLVIGEVYLEDKETGEKSRLEKQESRISQGKLYISFTRFQSGELSAHTFGETDCRNTPDEAYVILSGMKRLIDASGFRLEDVYYIHVTLQSMTDFQAFNLVYKSFFSYPNPPARCCIETSGQIPRVKMVVRGTTEKKTALHVQSLSSWAPANIGPYSQAQETPSGLHLSGCLGLTPSDMSLARDESAQINENLRKNIDIFAYDFINSDLIVAYYIGEKPSLPNAVCIQVTKLPKNANLEVEMHIKRTLPPLKIDTIPFESDGFSACLHQRFASSLLFGCFSLEISQCFSPIALIAALKAHLDAYFLTIIHTSPATRTELLSRTRPLASILPYITEVRVYGNDPYRYDLAWLKEVPSVFLVSQSEGILIRVEDSLQLATNNFLEDGK